MRYFDVKFRSLSLFLLAFVIGCLVHRKWFTEEPSHLKALNVNKKLDLLSNSAKFQLLSADGLYDESLSEDLFHEVKILCWVFTHPDNHQNKSVHIKNLWGKRCNKLLFMSTEEDFVLGTVKLPVPGGRESLWNKTIKTYQYVSGSRTKFDQLQNNSSFRFMSIIWMTQIGS
jgi:hypothetical protein